MQRTHSLVRDETFPGRGPSRDDFQDVETNSLGQRSALADDNLVAFLASKRRGNVRGNVRVSLFVSLVLFDKVQVIHAEDDGAVHFRRLDDAGQDSTSDGDVTGERALLVDIVAFDGLFRSLKAQTNVLVVTGTRFTRRFLSRRRGETVNKERGKEVSKYTSKKRKRRDPRANKFLFHPNRNENSRQPMIQAAALERRHEVKSVHHGRTPREKDAGGDSR